MVRAKQGSTTNSNPTVLSLVIRLERIIPPETPQQYEGAVVWRRYLLHECGQQLEPGSAQIVLCLVSQIAPVAESQGW